MLEQAKQYDFSKLVKWIGILLVCVLILNFGICFFSISAISTETTKYADSVVITYVREVQQMLDNIDNTMATEILYDDKLDEIQTTNDRIKAIKSTMTVKNLLRGWTNQSAFPVNYMIYLPLTDTSITGINDYERYIQWIKIEKDLIRIVVDNKVHTSGYRLDDWNVMEIQGKSYIIKYFHYKDRYICSWIEIDALIQTLGANGLGRECLFVISSENGEAYNNQIRLEEEDISIPDSLRDKSLIREFLSSDMIINKPIEGTSFSLNAVILGYSEVAGVLRVQIVLILIVGMIAVICMMFMLYIRKTVIKPIQNFSENIQKLRDDNNYSVETHYQISELKNASEILANLVNQINGLKIDIYERTLEQQKIKMDFLSLQIEPHFFLNCLNIIYHMVEIQKYKEVQNLSQCVSDYLRYIFKIGDNMASFGEELEHTKKYLEIQKIRYRDGFEVEIQVEEEILPLKVPPLMLQTFVENALKHTIDWEDKITISIRSKKIVMDDSPYISIEVEDSGEGFEEEILYKLRKGEDISEGEKRIGIMNAVQRIHLQYGEKGEIYFYNRVPTGAGVRIYIPIKEAEKEE